MKKTKLVLSFLLLALYSQGQSRTTPIAPSQNGSKTHFVLGPTAGNNRLADNTANNEPGTTDHTKSCAFVLEYGDGYFTTQSTSDHSYYSVPNSTQAVLSLSGRYDTIRPPQLFAKNVNGVVADPAGFVRQHMLNPGEYARITPIASTLNVNDEMLFILTYRRPPNATNGKLVVFYNPATFNALIPAVESDVILQTQTESDMPQEIKRLRFYTRERWAGSSDYNDASKTKSLTGSGYLNSMAWDIYPQLDTLEHNIFITLRTKPNFTRMNTGLMEAVLFYSSADTIDAPVSANKFSTALPLVSSSDPHDPNYIAAVPSCLIANGGDKPVNFKVHFQNEGAGTAHELRVLVHLDPALVPYIPALSKSSFRVTAGGNPVSDFDYKDSAQSILVFHILLNSDADPSHADITLNGNQVPMWYSNPLTMGDIEFQMKVPTSKEADLASYAEIIFFNKLGRPMAPVKTAMDTIYIRIACSENMFPVPKPLPKPTPDCYTILGICWIWWAVGLAALLLFILILIRRRRRRD